MAGPCRPRSFPRRRRGRSPGRKDEAIAAARRTAELAPDRPAVYTNRGAIYGFARQYDRSIQAVQSALALDRDNASAPIGLALTYSFMGRHDEAMAAAEPLLQRNGDQHALGAAACVFARAGGTEGASGHPGAAGRLALRARLPCTPAWASATRRSRCWKRPVQAREDEVADLGIDPTFDSLRGDPRMGRLLRRIGLPASR